jgi:replicative DNA helicase
MEESNEKALYNRDAEQAVAGSVLISPEVYDEVSAIISAADFRIDRLRWLWEACDRLHNRNESIDSLTVAEEMDRKGQLSEAGGEAFLTYLLNQVPTTLHAETYARIIAENSQRRRMLAAASQIAQAAYNRDLGAHQLMGAVEKAVRDAQERITARDNLKAADILSEVYDQAVERAKSPTKVWGMSTGFSCWDQITGGLHRGQTTIISAPPGTGKTTLVLQVARNVASKYGVLIHELEMDRHSLGAKLFASECGITTKELKSGFVPGDKWDAMAQTLAQYEKEMRLVINDTPGITTAQLRANLARVTRQMKIGLLVVDYVNLLADHDSRDDHENAAIKMRRLRDIAREFNVALLTIQSMNKEGMKNPFPDLADISGRADIAFDADTVFFMKKDEKDETLINMTPGKLRHGDGKKLAFYLRWDERLPNSTKYEICHELYHR